jgi:hypothetical protein
MFYLVKSAKNINGWLLFLFFEPLAHVKRHHSDFLESLYASEFNFTSGRKGALQG